MGRTDQRLGASRTSSKQGIGAVSVNSPVRERAFVKSFEPSLNNSLLAGNNVLV
jgi:hypothetical protein